MSVSMKETVEAEEKGHSEPVRSSDMQKMGQLDHSNNSLFRKKKSWTITTLCVTLNRSYFMEENLKVWAENKG